MPHAPFSTIALAALMLAAMHLRSAASHALTLAESGKVAATLVSAPNASASEQLAVEELADYLRRSTGASFDVLPEAKASADGSRIFVGPTAFARSHGIDVEKLGPEQWIIQTVGKDLIIAGGRPRGTLYAAYHFLEDVVGVHWWNPFEEHVPQHATLRVDDLKLQGKPGLQYRDIFKLSGHDEGRFAARNRLNRDGDDRIATHYGGCRDYGPPYHVRTFNRYFPPKEFFTKHPDWYSLAGEKRLAERGQLCLTQPDMRKAFLAKLRGYIDSSWAEARAAGDLPPLVFSVSQNDCLNPCGCANCRAIAKAEESECGPMLHFVNFLADAIKEQHPEVYLDTLAYQYTQKPPKTIKPRDNVIVRLCDTESDIRLPITTPENTAFREHLTRWAQVARNLRVWDYPATPGNPVGMPMPTTQTYGPDFRFYAAHNVEGVFNEFQAGLLADMRDFKVWLLMKQMEDPSASYEALVKTFTDGFYGPAGNLIRQYLADLEQEAAARRTRCDWNSTPQSLTYLNLAFVTRAHRLFDQAEKAVKNDAALLRRVRHARLPLDRATQALYPQLTSEWVALGQPPESAPPDREATSQRALDTWTAQAKLRLPAAAQKKERSAAEAEMRRFASIPASVAPPKKFRALPKEAVHDYIATMTRNHRDIVRVVEDPEAETGIANHLDLTAARVEHPERYVLPMVWGLYSSREKDHRGAGSIKAEDIPGPGYHWYQMGTFPVAPGYNVFFHWSWVVQAGVDTAFDPAKPDQKYEVWARIKFTGPRFPHARPGEKDAIYIERLTLVKSER